MTIERSLRRVVLVLSLAGAVVATSTRADAVQGWYLLMPSDNQIMMDGSIAKGVTTTQLSQTMAFDTAADCEMYRNYWGTLDMPRHIFVLLLVVGLALGGMAGTAAAGGGWYLLIPPRSSFNEHEAFLRGFKILDSKPLSEWGQEGAYDSAAECEAAKSSHVGVEQRYYEKSAEAYRKDLGANPDPAALKLQRYFTENANANVFAYLASRCVRSDDPRLGGRR